MYKFADIHDYQPTVLDRTPSPTWLDSVTTALQSRYQDDQCIQQLLEILSDATGIENISLAMPDSPSRFKAQYCSTGITNGVYSFAVQHALCRQFESREWLTLREQGERAEAFNPHTNMLRGPLRCLLVPVVIRQSTLAVLVIDLRKTNGDKLDLSLVNFFSAQIAATIATQVVPNFRTLYARPYQRVQEDEIDKIQSTIEKCNGNKTMAARVLGLTPRQLRYRLTKSKAEDSMAAS